MMVIKVNEDVEQMFAYLFFFKEKQCKSADTDNTNNHRTVNIDRDCAERISTF